MMRKIYSILIAALTLSACSKSDKKTSTPTVKQTFFKIDAKTSLDLIGKDSTEMNTIFKNYETVATYDANGKKESLIRVKGDYIQDTTHVALISYSGKLVDLMFILNIGNVITSNEVVFAKKFASDYSIQLGVGGVFAYGTKYSTNVTVSKSNLDNLWTDLDVLDYSYRPVLIAFETSVKSAAIAANIFTDDIGTSNSFVVFVKSGKISTSSTVIAQNFNKVMSALKLR